jgi:uncharacterized membrane protein YcjF (UPF0283 family)
LIKNPVARKFAQHVVPHVVRPARIIWNQIIGALFVLIAASVLFKSYQFIAKLGSEPENGARLLFTLPFGLLLLYFGITSFLRARRLSRM